jgi:protein CpxP
LRLSFGLQPHLGGPIICLNLERKEFSHRPRQASTTLNGEKWGEISMKRVLCCAVQSGVLIAGLVCGAEALAQQPESPPETSAPPPKQGPSGADHGMMDPDEQLARMTTRYSLTAEQQDQVKPILLSQQHKMQGLRQDTTLSREDRMAKMQTIRTDSNAKIKAVLNDDQKKQFDQDQLRMQRRMQQQGQGDDPSGGTPPR